MTDTNSAPNQGATGRLLGTNGMQRAVDSTERSIHRLEQAIGGLVPFFQGLRQGSGQRVSSLGSNWVGPNSYGTRNGGGYSFTNAQRPANPMTPTGGDHRADVPTSYFGGWGANGGSHRGTPSPAGMGFVAGAAASIGTQMMNGASASTASGSWQTDAMSLSTMARQVSPGALGINTNWSGIYNRGLSQMATNSTDLATGLYAMASNTGYQFGTAGFNKYQSGIIGSTLANPTMSLTQAAQTAAGFYSGQTTNQMYLLGIKTYKNGVQRSPVQIANQILNQIDPHHNITTDDQIKAEVDGPSSHLNQTLQTYISQGLIDPSQAQMVKDNIRMILKARSHGAGIKQLQSAINQRGTSDEARKQLQSWGIGDTDMQREKDLAASERQSTVDKIGGFDQGLASATDALIQFRDAVNGVMEATGLRTAQGVLGGLGSHGKLGFLAGALPGLGSIGGGMLSSLGSIIGLGGSNETRMSVGSGSASGSQSVTSNTQSSGSKVHASGGAAKNSAGQRLGWPCHGPITATFGQSGGHWSSGQHTGLDIGVPTGTPIHAAADGTIIGAGNNSAYGLLVTIDHGNGIETMYGHNSRIVKSHGAVRKGELIAYSGATGNVTGPHCHFEVRINGRPVDPLKYLNGAPLNISGSTTGNSTGAVGTSGRSGNGAGVSYGSGDAGSSGMSGPVLTYGSEAQVVMAALSMASVGSSNGMGMSPKNSGGSRETRMSVLSGKNGVWDFLNPTSGSATGPDAGYRGSFASRGNVVLQFNDGSIRLAVGSGVTPNTARALAHDFATALREHDGIAQLQAGR